MYDIRYTRQAGRQLERLDRPIKARVLARITTLASTPRPAGVRMIRGREGCYRVRVGDYRVLYEIMDEQLVILVIRVGHRREVYR